MSNWKKTMGKYTDTIGYQEFHDISPWWRPFREHARTILNSRKLQLLKRSGAVNVTNSVLRCVDDTHWMEMRLSVSFDSRGWTGL